MQRLKQHNEGAALPLDEKELLSAWATQTIVGQGWCVVRMRLAINGEAERSVHYHVGRDHTAFHHEWIVLPDEVMVALVAAVDEAFRERESLPEPQEDPQSLYRQIAWREGNERPKVLAVEYQHEKPVGPADAFESAWRLFASQFPSTRVVQQGIAGLVW